VSFFVYTEAIFQTAQKSQSDSIRRSYISP